MTDFLEHGEYGHRIQYQLYREIVFPVLLNGYMQQDLWCTRWLGITVANLYDQKQLHKIIRYKSEFDLLAEYYLLDPDNEKVREQLLDKLFGWFGFAVHEYDSCGYILWDRSSDSIDYRDLSEHIEFARELDRTNRYELGLAKFESKVNEFYKKRNVI